MLSKASPAIFWHTPSVALLNVERLKTAAPILKSFVHDKKIRVVGGIYELKSGRVELLT
jgi:carbonic anhydrase